MEECCESTVRFLSRCQSRSDPITVPTLVRFRFCLGLFLDSGYVPGPCTGRLEINLSFFYCGSGSWFKKKELNGKKVSWTEKSELIDKFQQIPFLLFECSQICWLLKEKRIPTSRQTDLKMTESLIKPEETDISHQNCSNIIVFQTKYFLFEWSNIWLLIPRRKE